MHLTSFVKQQKTRQNIWNNALEDTRHQAKQWSLKDGRHMMWLLKLHRLWPLKNIPNVIQEGEPR